jgi:hypothetical protein
MEKAVSLRSDKDRALRIMRATINGRRIVVVRFPLLKETLDKLQSELATKQKDRSVQASFSDEALAPICPKSQQWATAERKTMKSFFKVTHKGSPSTTTTATRSSGISPGAGSKNTSMKPNVATKRGNSISNSIDPSINKKTKSIASFFSVSGKK